MQRNAALSGETPLSETGRESAFTGDAETRRRKSEALERVIQASEETSGSLPRLSGVPRREWYEWVESDPAFRAAVSEVTATMLERQMHRTMSPAWIASFRRRQKRKRERALRKLRKLRESLKACSRAGDDET